MMQVPTRRFGRTELAMPVFTCGSMRYQHSWNDEDPDEIPAAQQANLQACVEAALAHGINHIETARGYGTSELQLGKVLPRFPREQLIVQTKIGPKETSAEFLEVFNTSMANLNLDYVDLLGIHGINNAELLQQTLAPGGTLAAARQLQKEGRVRFVGFSTHGLPETITAAIETGEFDYVNLHWYWVNPFTWPCIEAATKRDMGVFIISPNDKGGKLYEPSQKLVDLCVPLPPMAFNDLYCLSRPEVHTLSLGLAKPEDLDVHIDALQHYDEAKEVSAPIAARLEAEMDRVLGADWMAHWHENLPAWSEVPGDIHLHEILRLQNFALALDMVAFARMRYNLLGQAGHWFPGQNAALAAKHDLSACLKDYRFASEIPERLRVAHELLFQAPEKRLSEQ